jgi:hypothetical protein
MSVCFLFNEQIVFSGLTQRGFVGEQTTCATINVVLRLKAGQNKAGTSD